MIVEDGRRYLLHLVNGEELVDYVRRVHYYTTGAIAWVEIGINRRVPWHAVI